MQKYNRHKDANYISKFKVYDNYYTAGRSAIICGKKNMVLVFVRGDYNICQASVM